MLEDLYKYESLRGKTNFVSKPSNSDCKLSWNAFLKIVIHAIYYLNGKDVKTHPYDSLSTRPSRKRSSDLSEDGPREAITDQEQPESLRDDNTTDEVFDCAPVEVVESEPPKKAPRLSSYDMFAPDSPPKPSNDILTPLFEISTNSGETKPKTVRLQILSIVGIDKFGYIGKHSIILFSLTYI